MEQIETLRVFKQEHWNDVSALEQRMVEAREEIAALNLVLEERSDELMAEQEFSRGKEVEVGECLAKIEILKTQLESDVDVLPLNADLEAQIAKLKVNARDSAGIVAEFEQTVTEMDEEINSLRCDSIGKEKIMLGMEGRIEQLEQGIQDQLIDHKNECDSFVLQAADLKRELVEDRQSIAGHVDRIRRLEYQLSESEDTLSRKSEVDFESMKHLKHINANLEHDLVAAEGKIQVLYGNISGIEKTLEARNNAVREKDERIIVLEANTGRDDGKLHEINVKLAGILGESVTDTNVFMQISARIVAISAMRQEFVRVISGMRKRIIEVGDKWERRMKGWEDRCNRWQNGLVEVKTKVRRVVGEKSVLKAEVFALREDKENRVQDLDREIGSLNKSAKEIERIRGLEEELREERDGAEDRVKELGRENLRLKGEVEILRESIEVLESEAGRDEIVQLRENEIIQLRKELEEKEGELQRMETRMVGFEERAGRMVEECEGLRRAVKGREGLTKLVESAFDGFQGLKRGQDEVRDGVFRERMEGIRGRFVDIGEGL
jgi:chromosome segregation ATPase